MNTYLKWGILAGLFATLFIPFILLNGFFFPYITGKAFVFRIIVELIFGAWLLLALRDRKYRPNRSWILISATAFLVIVGIADLFGVHFEKSFWSNYERMEGYITIIHLYMYFLVASTVLNSQKLWSRFFATTLFASAFMAIKWGIPEYFEMVEAGRGVRIDTTFGNPIYLAVYSMIHVFLAAYYGMRYAKDKIMQGAMGVVVLLNLFMLYYTATRGTILGLIAGLGLTAFLVAVFERENKTLRKYAVGAVAAGLLFIAGFIAMKDTEFVQSSPVLQRFANISLDGGTATSPIMIWNMAYEGWMERPILGWGQGNFTWVFSEKFDPDMWGQEPWFDRAHNVFFDWLISAGILGLLAYLSMYAAALFHIWRKDENDFSVLTKSLLTGLLAGYFVHNIFVFDNLISYILFFTLLAYIHFRTDNAAPMHWYENMKDRFSTARDKAKDSPAQSEVLAPIVLVVTVVAAIMINYAPLKNNTTLIQAMNPQPGGVADNLGLFKEALAYDTFGRSETRERLVFQALDVLREQNIPQDIKREYERLAVNEMKKQIEEIEGDSKYALFLSSFYSQGQMFEEAETYAKLAREKSPQKQAILFELGNIYINQKRFNEALLLFQEAYESAPEFRDAIKLYALAAVYAEENDLAASKIEEYGLSFPEEIRGQYITEMEDGVFVPTDKLFLNAYDVTGQYDKVLTMWLYYVNQDPANPQNHFSLAAAYLRSGDRAMAIETLEKLKVTHPDAKDQTEYYIEQIKNGEI